MNYTLFPLFQHPLEANMSPYNHQKNDISPMSVISGVKFSPKRGVGGLRKGEKPPKFGVKTDQEPELSMVSYSIFINCVE